MTRETFSTWFGAVPAQSVPTDAEREAAKKLEREERIRNAVGKSYDQKPKRDFRRTRRVAP